MQSVGLSAFAKAREEIQFWPAAAMGFIFSTENSAGALVGFFILLQAGAITYKLHEAIRKLLPKQSNIAEVKKKNSRDGVDYGKRHRDIASDIFRSVSPDSGSMMLIVGIAAFVNVASFPIMLVWLGLYLFHPAHSFAAVGLISLPLLMFAIMIASIIWTS